METPEMALINIFVFVFGSCIGSFLNVVIYRLPAKMSLLYPPSRCPVCEHSLGKTENVPVLGWLWLRGRCRWCHTSISARYPLLEATTGLLFLLIFWQFGLGITTLGYWVLLSWLIALALIDLDTMTLPNLLTQSGLFLGLAFQALRGWNTGQIAGSAEGLLGGVGGAVLGVWFFDLILIVGTLILHQPAMGGGDPKLAGMIGAWLGWRNLLVTSFLACGIGSLIGGGAIALGLLTRRQAIPFGPFLALGAALALFWGDTIVSTYIKVFFPY
jgi:leader peptidase (prepilin peptidase)/N-methyltransferase